MIEGEAPPPKSPPASHRIRRWFETNPAVGAIALYALVAIAALLAGYWAMFNQFAYYDDQGTLLITVKAFLRGEALYREIWSVYGPFYYEIFGAFFKLTGIAITTDSTRMIVLVIWVGASLLFGLVAQRLTGYLMLGVTAMIAAFSALGVLISEPMHPQGLCVLLLGAIVLLIASNPKRRFVLGGAATGLLLGALILTKVNLGLFAVAALVLAAALLIEWACHRRWLRWLQALLIVAFLLMPLVILARDLNIEWVREMLILEVLATAAVLVAGGALRNRRIGADAGLVRWLLAAAAGFVVAVVLILLVIVVTGPSLRDVYEGVITQAFQISDVLKVQFPFPGQALDWAIAAVAAAALAVRLQRDSSGPSIWSGILRAVAGVAIWLSIAHIAPLDFGASSGNPDVIPLLLAWVAVIPPLGVEETPFKRFARMALALLAVAETLQVYPVAGSQMGIASVVFIPIGAICLADALTDLRAWTALRGRIPTARLTSIVAIATVALAGIFALSAIVLTGASNLILYRHQTSLKLPGAEMLHLPQADEETYVGTVDFLHEYRCTTFVGYPNVPSLYLWSGIESPKPQVPNAWMNGLSHDQQQQVVDEMKASPRPCALSSGEGVDFYLPAGEAPPAEPLVEYVLNDFTPVSSVGGVQLMLPKARAKALKRRER